MFYKNKENNAEEDVDPPVPNNKATKSLIENKRTKTTSFAQKTPEEDSVSESDSTVDYKDWLLYANQDQ